MFYKFGLYLFQTKHKQMIMDMDGNKSFTVSFQENQMSVTGSSK